MGRARTTTRKNYPLKGLERTVVWLTPETKRRLADEAAEIGASLSRHIALKLGERPMGRTSDAA